MLDCVVLLIHTRRKDKAEVKQWQESVCWSENSPAALHPLKDLRDTGGLRAGPGGTIADEWSKNAAKQPLGHTFGK